MKIKVEFESLDEFKEYMDKNNNGLWYIPDELK